MLEERERQHSQIPLREVGAFCGAVVGTGTDAACEAGSQRMLQQTLWRVRRCGCQEVEQSGR